ncbi:hypothetical protein N4G70_36175 [Streptomyces sp. ASQP_92]|uniref:hypothetical protein n=1 Tax=Streptomyces sp. ASQP_92 TaxID=2979116 RepID=UPI0021C05B0B|nr:hypothetical protein [Streptomyces sp. ASQP_92]MCT9094240.1 hypothetical protein [Streptomyces sp. ASQP_92]
MQSSGKQTSLLLFPYTPQREVITAEPRGPVNHTRTNQVMGGTPNGLKLRSVDREPRRSQQSIGLHRPAPPATFDADVNSTLSPRPEVFGVEGCAARRDGDEVGGTRDWQ